MSNIQRTSGARSTVISHAWETKISKSSSDTPSKSRNKPQGMNMFSPVSKAPAPSSVTDSVLLTVVETAVAATADLAVSDSSSQASQPAAPLLVIPPRHMNKAELKGYRFSQKSCSSIAQQLSLLKQLREDADSLVKGMKPSNATGPSPTSSGLAGSTSREPPSTAPQQPHRTHTPEPTAHADPAGPSPSPAGTPHLPSHTNSSDLTSDDSQSSCSGGAIAALREADRGAKAAWLGSESREVLVSTSVVSAWHDIDTRGAFLASGGGGVSGDGLGLGSTAAERARMEAAARNPSRATLQSVYRLQQLQRLQQEGVALVAQMSS